MWTKCFLLLLAWALAHATAQLRRELSSVLKREKFTVQFLNDTMPMAEALEWIGEWPGKAVVQQSPFLATNKTHSFSIHSITDSEVYLCQKPLVEANAYTEQSTKIDLSTSEAQATLTRGLALLENLRGVNLIVSEVYFTHFLRYGHYILQFPFSDLLDGRGVLDLSNHDSLPENYYLLGLWDNAKGVKSELIPFYDTPSADLDDDSSTLYADDSFYIQQVWNGGTICDLNGLPRTTIVKASTFHLHGSIIAVPVMRLFTFPKCSHVIMSWSSKLSRCVSFPSFFRPRFKIRTR